MFRLRHLISALGVLGMIFSAHAEELHPKSKSKVAIFEDPSVVSRFQIDHQKAYDAFNKTLLAFTGKKNVAEAWKTLVNLQDIVGIRITAPGNPTLATPPDVLKAVIDGLKQAGVKPANIVVWDKSADELMASGYVPTESVNDWKLRAVLPDGGFDDKKFYFNEMIGKLIWGDHEFVGTKQLSLENLAATGVKDKDKIEGDTSNKPPDQLSNRSHFAKIVTQDITKLINLAIMSDHPALGLYGACSTLAMACVDNHRRFYEGYVRGDPAVPEILMNDVLKGKMVLHVMTGFIAQYAGGPDFNPHYTESPGILMMSRDPVAIDTLALEQIEAWRENKTVPAVGDNAKHLSAAARLGLGANKKDHMEIIKVSR